MPALRSPPPWRPSSRRRQLLAQGRADGGRRRLLDQLLVASLDRALALAEGDDVAVRVAEELHFDVSHAVQELLDVDVVVAERRAASLPATLSAASISPGCARRACPCRRRRRPPSRAPDSRAFPRRPAPRRGRRCSLRRARRARPPPSPAGARRSYRRASASCGRKARRTLSPACSQASTKRAFSARKP